MVHVAIDLVLVDALGEQFTDNEEDVGIVRIVGKTSRIGHHATVDWYSEGLLQLVEAS